MSELTGIVIGLFGVCCLLGYFLGYYIGRASLAAEIAAQEAEKALRALRGEVR